MKTKGIFRLGLAAALLAWPLLYGCDGESGSTICPVPDIRGACRHEAVYCALVIGQREGMVFADPYIQVGMTDDGMHAVCRTGRGEYVRMAYLGVIVEDAPLYPWTGAPRDYSIEEYLEHFFPWSVQ